MPQVPHLNLYLCVSTPESQATYSAAKAGITLPNFRLNSFGCNVLKQKRNLLIIPDFSLCRIFRIDLLHNIDKDLILPSSSLQTAHKLKRE